MCAVARYHDISPKVDCGDIFIIHDQKSLYRTDAKVRFEVPKVRFEVPKVRFEVPKVRFEVPKVSFETLMTLRGSAKISGTKSLLRCVQTWWPTTRNARPL